MEDVNYGTSAPMDQGQATPVPTPMPQETAANTSGQGKMSVLPPELKRWNWGAFGFTWLWGIFNGTFIALLAFIPFVNIIMIFVLGAKGNQWAWQNKQWRSVEHFQKVQKAWARVFVVFLIIAILGIVASILTAEPPTNPTGSTYEYGL